MNPLSCVPIGDAAGAAASGVLGNAFAEAMRDGASWVIRTTIGWWIEVPAIDLAASPASTIRGYVLWLAAVVATAGAIWQGVVIAVSRRGEPFFAAVRGLFYLALWASVGIIGPAAALRAGDAFSSWVLGEAADGEASERLVRLAGLGSVDSAGAVIVLGLAMMLVGLVQAILMMFREGSVVILSGALVLAAAGSLTQATRPWLPKVLGWMAALIAYKPVAALVYASAIAMVGEGDDPRTVVVGLTMMLLAVIALPALLKLFNWTTAGAGGGGGGGMAAVAASSAAAIHAHAALRSTSDGEGRGGERQAEHIRHDLAPTVWGTSPAAATPSASASTSAAPAASSFAGAGSAAAAGAGAAVVMGAQATERAARRGGEVMNDLRSSEDSGERDKGMS
jgi:hypothetical protein